MQITHHQYDSHEQVVSFVDKNFHCIIAIHSTRLGPAVGGCRLKPYGSPDDAMTDALRLAKGMTYKCSLAGINFGGAKAVLLADRPTRDMMLRFGDAVNYFKGDYVTAEDVGTNIDDLAITGEITSHLTWIDGSAMTARGVLAAMTAALLHQRTWGDSLDGVPIWIQGLGKVGMNLANSLSKLDFPNLFVSDLRSEAVQQSGAREISESDKKFVAIYAPCAMGQIINADNIATINHSIICGAANNQLTDDAYAEILHKKGILYCPDFLVNSGGVINGACEIGQVYDRKRAEDMTDAIGICTMHVLNIATKEKVPPLTVAHWLAEARL